MNDPTPRKKSSRSVASRKTGARKKPAGPAAAESASGRGKASDDGPPFAGSFASVVGHQRTIEHVKRLLTTDRMPHALLLIGEEGIGKFRVAVRAGRARLCGESPDDACGQCLDCRLSAAGDHADLHVLDRPEAVDLSIDEIRTWIEISNQKPFRARGRTLVVRDAHRLTRDAQNAFLKRLEEPPPECVQILTTHQPEALVATIRSRCRELRLQPLTGPETAQVLEANEGASDRTSLLASMSGGSPGKALALDRGGFLALREPWLALVSGQVEDPLGTVQEIVARFRKEERIRQRSRMLVEMWITLLRDLLVTSLEAPPAMLVHQDLAGAVAVVARGRPAADWQRCCEAGRAALKALAVNALPELVVSHLVLQVAPETGIGRPEMFSARDLR